MFEKNIKIAKITTNNIIKTYDKVSVTQMNDKIIILGIFFICLLNRNIKNEIVLPIKPDPIITNETYERKCEKISKLSVILLV
jgi:hypothetical protein